MRARFVLALLGLVTAMPMLVLLLVQAEQRHAAARAQIEAVVEQDAARATEAIEAALRNGETLLALVGGAADPCRALSQAPHSIGGRAVVASDGTVLCSEPPMPAASGSLSPPTAIALRQSASARLTLLPGPIWPGTGTVIAQRYGTNTIGASVEFATLAPSLGTLVLLDLESGTVLYRVGQANPPLPKALEHANHDGIQWAPSRSGEMLLLAVRHVPAHRLAVIRVVPDSLAMASADDARHLVWAVGAIVMVGSLALFAFLADRILLHPLHILSHAIGMLARGRPAPFIRIPTPAIAPFTLLRTRLISAGLHLREIVAARRREHVLAEGLARRLAVWDQLGETLILQFDQDLRLIAVSGACERLLGSAPGLQVDAEHEALYEGLLAAARAGESPPPIRLRVRRADGGLVWLDLAAVSDARGGIVVTGHDIGALRDAQERLAQTQAQLAALALEDPLTGLANRRRFDDALAQEMRRCQRQGEPLALLFLTPADFSSFRSQHGDLQGEACLRRIARAATAALSRPGDMAARIAPWELAILLPSTGAVGAAIVTQRIRRAVRALHIGHALSEPGIVTINGGFACLRLGAPQTAEALLAEARGALRPDRETSLVVQLPDYSVASGASDLISSNTRLRTAGSVIR